MMQPTPTKPAVPAQAPIKRKPRPSPVRFTDWASI